MHPKVVGPETSGIGANRVENYVGALTSAQTLGELDVVAHHLYNGGNGTQWQVPRVDRVIAATQEFTELLAGPMTIDAANIVGATNQQGASRMRALVY